jgi:hypothetical protein
MKKSLPFLLIRASIVLFTLTNGKVFPQPGRDWSIVATYPIPGKASGLAWDGSYIYSGLYGSSGPNNLIYKIDPDNGTYTLQCEGPFETAYGLTFDGTDFWTTDRTGSYTPAIAVRFDYSGNFISNFNLPRTYHSGIAYDNGDFWTCCYYDPDGMVYKLDNAGNILLQFPSPNNQPWDICVENDNLWIADYNANMLYKTDKTGNLLESHASAGVKPSGVVFDGQYLWYCDGELSSGSTLYKVDLGGAGTPVIYIPEDSHDFGVVTIGDSVTWQMQVQNTGSADLELTGVDIPAGEPVHTSFTPPQIIAPGTSLYIPLTFQPVVPEPMSTVVTITSTDPVTPAVPVTLTGDGVAAGPFIVTSDDGHDYGQVRIRAFTRWFLTVYNKGSETLIISGIDLSTGTFSLDEAVTLPLEIGVLDSVRIGVWFNPIQELPYSDIMQIISNDPGQNPFNVTLEGSGLDIQYPIGEPLWHYNINTEYDNSPKAIAAIADVTGDGVGDVIICSEDDYVRCFNGNSYGVADVIWEHEVYAGAVQGQNDLVTVPDINGDGYEDIIIGTAWGDRSIIALSGKTGQQIWKHDTHEYGDGGWVYQVDSRFDYNGDGIKDVLASTGNDGNYTGPIRIYCLDGTNGDPIWECMTGGPNFSVIGVEDFTGDGIPDAVSGSSTSDESEGRVFGIDGSDGSIFWTFNTEGSSVWAVEQLEDINGDQVKDIIAGDFSGNIYYINASNGSDLGSISIGLVLVIRFEMMDDVNGDGHPDVLVAHSGTNGIVLSGKEPATIWTQVLPDKPWCVARSNDLNGDAISDALIGTLYTNNYCYFRDGVTGANLKSMNYGEAIDAIQAIPDIVGDGSWEMVVGGRDGKVYCYSGGLDAYVGIKESNNAKRVNLQAFCYPNPFSNETTISVLVPEDISLNITVSDMLGKQIKTLVNGPVKKGNFELKWDGTGDRGLQVRPGVYFIQVGSVQGIISIKVIRTQ